mmetsp:Transcript_54737/g.146529  ORF Transcript_54737/g.146529 Transcript_54737/m.146529 type:complete len:219 (-) Transcript_54737:451-1107(-)
MDVRRDAELGILRHVGCETRQEVSGGGANGDVLELLWVDARVRASFGDGFGEHDLCPVQVLLAEPRKRHRGWVLQVTLEIGEVPSLDVAGLEEGPVGMVLRDLEHVGDLGLGPAVLFAGRGETIAEETAAATLGLGPVLLLRQIKETTAVFPAALLVLCSRACQALRPGQKFLVVLHRGGATTGIEVIQVLGQDGIVPPQTVQAPVSRCRRKLERGRS